MQVQEGKNCNSDKNALFSHFSQELSEIEGFVQAMDYMNFSFEF
jgi:hypothetical protein